MDKQIKRLVQISTLRDVQIKLLEAKQDGFIIPQIVFEIVRDLEDSYDLNEHRDVLKEWREKDKLEEINKHEDSGVIKNVLSELN